MQEVENHFGRMLNSTCDRIPGIELRLQEQLALLARFRKYNADPPFERRLNAHARFYYPNGSFPYQDAFTLSAIIRELRPTRIIEVGCGASSCVILDTCEVAAPNTEITFIEPYPELLLRLTKPEDQIRSRLKQSLIQDVPLDVFEQLGENDILFVDTSHVSKVGSDVNHIFLEILPVLKPGVVVHFHDIGYPFEYPKEWFGYGMFWNEAYLLRAFLMYNVRFEILLFNGYLNHLAKDEIGKDFPLFIQEPGKSIWLRRK